MALIAVIKVVKMELRMSSNEVWDESIFESAKQVANNETEN